MQFENVEMEGSRSRVLAAPSTAQPFPVQFDIWKDLEELRRSPDWQGGIARKVLTWYPELQITLRAMKANTRIPKHHNPGRVCVQMVQGQIRMHVEDKLVDLPQGKALVLDPGITHDVEALEESAFLLIVAPAPASER
jgi:quercetin dioxygenase-like cupin family protein